MFFVRDFKDLTNVNAQDIDYLVSRTKWDARRRIISYQQKTQEKLLDKYIRQNYKTSLIQMCLKIVSKANYLHDTNGTKEITITITDPNLDKIASLTTYGTGKIQGSNILKNAFK